MKFHLYFKQVLDQFLFGNNFQIWFNSYGQVYTLDPRSAHAPVHIHSPIFNMHLSLNCKEPYAIL